jgi:hypothetical protein
MASYAMLRRVAVVRTYVLEELSASFIRVTRIGELGTTLAVTGNRRTLRRLLVLTRAARRNIPEDAILLRLLDFFTSLRRMTSFTLRVALLPAIEPTVPTEYETGLLPYPFGTIWRNEHS